MGVCVFACGSEKRSKDRGNKRRRKRNVCCERWRTDNRGKTCVLGFLRMCFDSSHDRGVLWELEAGDRKSDFVRGSVCRILWDVLLGKADMASFDYYFHNTAHASGLGVTIWMDGAYLVFDSGRGITDYRGFGQMLQPDL